MFINYGYRLLFIVIEASILCVVNTGIFYPCVPIYPMGIGYKRNLYPLTAMGTNDKQNQRGQVQV
jgi:hypothetical protein